jgi:hypothetical protein
MAETEKKLTGEALEDFMATARKHFEQDVNEEKEIREEALQDLKFVAGDQWNPALKAARDAAGRPALSFPRCHTFVQQVSNEARQNKPQVKFVASEDEDKDLATVYEGLARHIQYDSDAQVAYETATEYSAGGGFGYHGLITEYCDDESDDQDLKVRTFPDPFSVYGLLIPYIMGVEADHGFVVSHLTKEEYELQYPDSDMAGECFDWDNAKSAYGDWVGEKVRIAEYWVVEKERKTNKLGRVYYSKTVKFYKINACEILEETEWQDEVIPIFPVLGKQMVVDGKPKVFSVIRFQRDPQQLINLYKSRIAETLSVSSIQPFMADPRQIKGYEKEWANLNRNPHAILPVNLIIDGQVVPPPQRQVIEAPIQAYSEAAAQEIDDMKATAGIYDASLGSQGNETSGIALQRRQQQSNVTNLHIMDNLERSFKKSGSAVARLLDVIYTTKRKIRILGADEAPKIVAINQQNKDGKHYKFGEAKFDVVVTMGRAFSTKRMESFDMMTSVLQTSPDLLPMVGDIFFANSDMAGADQLAERFKKMLPPNLQEQPDGQKPDPEQVMAENAQLKQQMQVLGAQLQDAQNPLKVEEIRQQSAVEQKKLQLDHDKTMASAKFEHELQMKKMDVEAKTSTTVMQHDTAEAIAQHNSEAAAAMKIYETEAMLKAKQIDRDQAQQVQEAKEADATAKAL